MQSDILFEVTTVLGKKVHITKHYWQLITDVKHPVMRGEEAKVKKTLAESDEVRMSKRDSQVYLYYKFFEGRYICVVVKHESKEKGYLVTTYLTSKIKEGEMIWKK